MTRWSCARQWPSTSAIGEHIADPAREFLGRSRSERMADGDHIVRRIIPITVAAALSMALAVPAAQAGDESLATEAVFERQHLDNIVAPVTLRYRYERSGSLLGVKDDQAELVVTGIGADGRKQVEFRLFSGADARHIAPQQGYRNNPMIVAFLQRDVEQMGRLTGGSPHYFRNRIRAAFAIDAAVRAEAVTVPFEGREVAGTEVTIEPFVNDPNLPRFRDFQYKRYEFVLAPAVPGGVYRLRAVTPNGTAEPLLDEQLAYSGSSAPPTPPRAKPAE